MTLRLQCWSGPRNVSTALMYSFRQRADTTVVDEPLYAHYLAVTGRSHPGRDAVIASQSTDADHVIGSIILGPCSTPVLFVKQMAHHLIGVDRSFLAATENVLLTRDPSDMLLSLAAHLPDCRLADTGLEEQVALLDAIVAEGGRPVVVDSQVLLRDPPRILAAVCERVGLSFDRGMLAWPAGPKPEDGVWADEWYHNVHRSTGFATHAPKSDPLPDELLPVLAEAQPLFDRLIEYSLPAGTPD